MNSLAYIPGSDGAANASLMTVTDVRSPGATTIQVNTVANASTKFYASMGTPNTFTDPVTGETITVISEATAVDFAGTIDGSNVEIVEIAPGYTDNGSEVGDIIVIRPVTEWANNIFNLLSVAHNDDGSLKANPELINNFIGSGGVVAQVATLTGSFSDIIYYINGLRVTASGIANKLYTASKDTYVDIDDTGAVTYTEVANNAAAPSLAANNVRVAKVVTNGSTITSVLQNAPDGSGNWIKPSQPITSALDSGYRDLPLASGVVTDTDRAIRYKRVGDTVFVSGRFIKSSGSFSNTDMGTLPVGFRPFGGTGDLTFTPGAASGYVYRSVVFGTTGVINSGVGSGAGNFIDINISFRCA